MESYLDRLESQMLSLDQRNILERKPLSRAATLAGALRSLPARWTGAMCRALKLKASGRDGERKKAIGDYLVSDGSMEQVWKYLPEPSRMILSWLVAEKQGCSSVRALYEQFGRDYDVSYRWDRGMRPTTPLGILRLYGLVFKGTARIDQGMEKIVVVPVELRPLIEKVVLGSAPETGAPPMPKPDCLNETGLWDPLEWTRATWTRNPDRSTCQFLVVLRHVEPKVWRRILVPGGYSFWDLHVAIQDAMGWEDRHLHQFRLKDPGGGNEVIVGIPDASFGDPVTLPDRLITVADYFSDKPVEYLYDYGDDWFHEVVLEVFREDLFSRHPLCIAGERACPPEDCGGPSGYEELLAALSDPDDPEHAEILEWLDETFDPESFDPQSVHFDKPNLRWRAVFLKEEEAHRKILMERQFAEMGLQLDARPQSLPGNLPLDIPGAGPVPGKPGRSIPEINERERLIVESAVRAAGIDNFRVDVTGDRITVLLAAFDASDVIRMQDTARQMFPESSNEVDPDGIPPLGRSAEEVLEAIQHYTPYMRFVLEKEAERIFITERMVFHDQPCWMPVGNSSSIERLANSYCRHLGRESFYNLT